MLKESYFTKLYLEQMTVAPPLHPLAASHTLGGKFTSKICYWPMCLERTNLDHMFLFPVSTHRQGVLSRTTHIENLPVIKTKPEVALYPRQWPRFVSQRAASVPVIYDPPFSSIIGTGLVRSIVTISPGFQHSWIGRS